MGYTHYWYRQKMIKPEIYDRIVQDFRRLLPAFKTMGVRLAGGLGEGSPDISLDEVRFNGDKYCGHPIDEDICIAWPTDDARGLASIGEAVKGGTWFAGALLSKRFCDGDCSHETFHFPCVLELLEWQKPKEGLYFEFCKTAFKPYDLAVTAFLVIAKHHLKNKIRISSDGRIAQWQDAIWLCQLNLGLDLMDFQLEE